MLLVDKDWLMPRMNKSIFHWSSDTLDKADVSVILVINKKKEKTNRWKIDSFTSGSSPPLWYSFFSGNSTHGSSLVRHPINCHVSIKFPLIVACRHHTQWIDHNWHFPPTTQRHHEHMTCHWCQYDWPSSEFQVVCQDKRHKAWG